MTEPSLAITHSHRDGTLVEGTARGDGTSEILRTTGWRYSRAVGWYAPRSRDLDADRQLVARTRDALVAAGFAVDVEIDDTRRTPAQVDADRIDREQERAVRLRGRADRIARVATAAGERSGQLSEGWPLGQPIISDAARRSHRRIREADARSRAASEAADTADQAATAAEGRLGASHSPQTVANRIDRLTATRRRLQRKLDGYTEGLSGLEIAPLVGASRKRAAAELEQTISELEHWKGVRAAHISSGRALNLSPGSMSVGDLVQHGRQWYRVIRVNKVSVTVEYSVASGTTTGTLPLTKITAHRSAPS